MFQKDVLERFPKGLGLTALLIILVAASVIVSRVIVGALVGVASTANDNQVLLVIIFGAFVLEAEATSPPNPNQGMWERLFSDVGTAIAVFIIAAVLGALLYGYSEFVLWVARGLKDVPVIAIIIGLIFSYFVSFVLAQIPKQPYYFLERSLRL